MYKILCSDGTVLYDQSDVNTTRVVTEPQCTREIGQNSSTLSFSMLPDHPAYDSIQSMETYLSAEEDNEEIFYGRVTEIRTEQTTGVKQISCTGSMSFLDDFELPPIPNGEQNMTAADFFRRCINGYGTELGGDYKRALGVGTINHSKSNVQREFGMTSYTKVKSALDTYIIKEFGGYLRIRVASDSSAKVNAARIQQDYFQLGNVKLLERPTVTAQMMQQAGWEVPNGETSTVYSLWYSAGTDGLTWAHNVIIHVTPIKSNGSVMTPAQLDAYVETLIRESANPSSITTTDKSKDSLVLYVQSGITNWNTAHAQADLFDELLHNLQAVYYLNDDSALPTQAELRQFNNQITIVANAKNHVVDWLESYGVSNASPIELANNVITHENAITSNDFFTVIHPLGKDSAGLPEVTVNVDDALVATYGRIVKTVSFANAKNAEELRSEVNEYKTKMAKGLGKTCNVKLIDVHFLDNVIGRIQLGAVYTNISGFYGEDMTVFSMEQHFENPSEDKVVLKNHRELSAVKNGASTGKISKIISSAFENIHKHITETADMLSIHANLIELHGVSIRETAQEFERYSRDTDSTIGEILGTGVLQNSDHITQVAGNFTSKYTTVTSQRLAELTAKGISPKSAGLYKLVSTNVSEWMIGSGIEVFGSPNAALNGVALDTSSLTIGQPVYMAELATDNQVEPGTTYYSKALMVGKGTEVIISEEGHEINVYESIDNVQENLLTVTGSALWTQRNNITGVVGEFQIETDPETFERRLVVVSGGGMKILRDNVEYGVYDNGNLTGGIIVEKINDVGTITKISGDKVVIGSGQTQQILTTAIDNITDFVGEFDVVEDPNTGVKTIVLKSGGGMKVRRGTTEFGIFDNGNLTGGIVVDKINGQGGSGTLTQIRGEFVDITADQVRIGSTSNVAAWMSSTGQDISNLQGLVADRATIAQLNAQKARIDELETVALTAENIQTSYLAGASISVHALAANNISANSITLTAGVSAGGDITGGDITGNALYGDSLSVSGSVTANGHDISDPLVSASVNGDTLTLTKASGASVTFRKAATAHLVGNWGGKEYTVYADNDPNVLQVSSGVLQAMNYDDGSTSGQNAKIRIYTSAEIVGDFTVAVPNVYTNGRNAGIIEGAAGVTLTVGGWQNGANRVTASNGQYKDVTLPSFSTSGGTSFTDHKTTVHFTTASVSGPVKSVEVDATSEYNSGWTGSYNAIGLSATTSAASYGDTITIYATGKSTPSASSGNISSKKFTYTVPADRYNAGANSVTLTVGGWQNGANRVTASNGQYKDVTLPSFSTSGGTNFTNHKTTVNFTTASVSGPVKSVEVDATSEYNSGWTGSYNAVTLSATGTKNLTYGESVTIYPKAKSSSGANAANITTISYKVTAPADRYQTGYNQGHLDGVASVTITKVEQQGAITYSGGNYSVPAKATASNGETGAGTITFAGTSAYNAGWNACLAACGLPNGGAVRTGGTYYANLYVMGQSGPSRVGSGYVGVNSVNVSTK